MATAAEAPSNADLHTSSSSIAKINDVSLWWDAFSDFLTDLENAAMEYVFTESLRNPLISRGRVFQEKKLKENHIWFLDTVTKFKKPSQSSRKALESPRIRIGEHELNVVRELREAALKISSILCLDEVQAYILVKRTLERNSSEVNEKQPDFLNLVVVDYYTERQCLLKCTRDILVHALYFGSQSNGDSAVLDEAQSLVNNDLEGKLLSVLEGVLSSNYSAHMDVDISIMWYEEMVEEGKLIVDILFLIYYESFSTCDAKCWKRLSALYEGVVSGSYHIQKLAVTPEAVRAVYLLKVQLLLILIEALNLESLLQMLHDNEPLSKGSIGFSEADILQMDTIVSSLSAFQANETGPLILSWAVFLSLISSLPGEELKSLMELENIGYSRQSFEVSSLEYFLEILDGGILKSSDGPVAGYWSVMRTFISAFLASFEINVKFGDKSLKLMLEILSKIYRGEESLCVQFWDKESCIDGPVRCLLFNLESEFPFKTTEFVCLLSALCEGSWPAECVYNFLDKTVGITTSFEMSNGSTVGDASNIVETSLPLRVPRIEGLVVPSTTHGQVFKIIDENCVLVRWERIRVLVLLLRLAQQQYMPNLDELVVILDLICRLVDFNLGVCYSLLAPWSFLHEEPYGVGRQEISVDVVAILCTLLKGLSPSVNGTVAMSLGIKVLAKMLTCLPSRVSSMAMKSNIFDAAFGLNPFGVSHNSSSSGFWMLTGRLSKMLLIDCEESDCSLTLAVLEFTINLLEIGLQNEVVLALVVFALQYVLVNHELWTYKVKHARWKVTLKVFEVVKKCVWSSSYHHPGWQSLHDVLFSDSSIHSVILRIVCTTTPILEKLSFSRLFETWDIEGLHLALSSGLDVLADMVSFPSKESPSFPVFQGAVLSPMRKPVPVVTAAVSLTSYFRNRMIQIRSARLLAALFVADSTEGLIYSNTNLGLSDIQVSSFRKSICRSLSEHSPCNEDIAVAVMQLLSAAASNQPAFLNFIFMSNRSFDAEVHDTSSYQPNKSQKESNSKEECIFSAIRMYLEKSEDLFQRKSKILLCVLNLLRELWQGAPRFLKALENLKGSDGFWRLLTYSAVVTSSNYGGSSNILTEKELQEIAYRYQCLSNTLDILNYEVFLQKKLVHAKLIAKQISGFSSNETREHGDSEVRKDMSLHTLRDIFSSWCKGSILSNLVKVCASWEYDRSTHMRAKFSSCLVAVHIMLKIRTGEMGSLSVFLIDMMSSLSQKLCKLPAFLELLTQYAEQGYSERQEIETLIFSDLFYHIRGELDGRQINNKLFKELIQFLIDSNPFAAYYKYSQGDLLPDVKASHSYDLVQLRTDMGLKTWDHLRWKESREIGETMLLLLQHENSAILCTKSKLQALRGLITLLHMTEAEVKNDGFFTMLRMSEEVVWATIQHVCQCLHATLEFVTPNFDVLGDVIDILEAQAQLLLVLIKNASTNISQSACLNVLSTSGSCLKVLCSCRPSNSLGNIIEILLMLILCSAKLVGKDSHSKEAAHDEFIDGSPQASSTSLGLLPVLCACISRVDSLALSVVAVDLILKGFSKPLIWFPILQRHLPLQHIVNKLQDVANPKVIPVILKFLLNIAQVREGAEMLLNAGILEYLRVLLDTFDGRPSSSTDTERVSDKTGNPPVWGLCLAVLTAVVQFSGDVSSSATIVDFIVTGMLVEKAPLVSHHVRVPDFSSDGDDSKRARSLLPTISFNDLKETQNAWALICVLARDWNSWKRAPQNMESQLREKSIHLLALIGKVAHRAGEPTKRDAPLLCCPVLKEEFECYKKPSFINSQNGWFALAALSCKLDPKSLPLSYSMTALNSRDQLNGISNPAPHTHFSDLVSIEIYKIGFLLLKFLCIQAENAARKAEDVGFVDLTHFPELPMPDILHGLQDQGITIITELCAAAKEMIDPETQEVCLLLWHITIMSLHLEYCVIQICGIRPVLGHVEILAKELRLLFQATEGHGFLKEPMNSLKQIVCFLYPELLHHEVLL